MKVFWAWQSDIEPHSSRHFIKKCLEKAILALNQEPDFSEREIELDHDTKDVPGTPPITETIFEKINNASIFVGDVTPIAKTKGGKKIMNPNVAIELGYATAKLTDKRIITVMNSAYGDFEDLPFDLRHKRGPIQFTLEEDSTPEQRKEQQEKLTQALTNALKLQSIDSIAPYKEPDFDKSGPAIFFDPTEPLFRDSENGWGSVKEVGYLVGMERSYVYTKVVPNKALSIKKADLIAAMFRDSKFYINPLFTLPTNTPTANKYGAVVVKQNMSQDRTITDITQVFTNGAVIGISNSFLKHAANKIHLSTFNSKLIAHLIASATLIKQIAGEENFFVKLEVGIVNQDSCTIVKPSPADPTRYYPEPEVGPLENILYSKTVSIKVSHVEQAAQSLAEDFIVSLFDDLGIVFDFKYHKWD